MIVAITLLGLVLIILLVAFRLNKYRTISNYFSFNENENTTNKGVLKVLTYNVAGLPQRLSSAKTPRHTSMIQIGAAINGYDFVNVQEDFNYNIQLYSENLHPYKTAHRGKAIWGDGLNTFSNFTIYEFRRIAWKNCNGADCLTPKGFTLARVGLAKGVLLDVYNVHATAGVSRLASNARRKNLLQLAEYIRTHSKDKAMLVMGDFNAYYQSRQDNMRLFLEYTGLRDCWVEIILKGNVPITQDDFIYGSILDFTDYTESIDKILYRSSSALVFNASKYAIERYAFRDMNGRDLSDHLPVMAELSWEYRDVTGW